MFDWNILGGSRRITAVHGGEEAVVVLSVREYRRLTGHTPRLIDCLLNAPRGEALVVTRPREPIRDPSR